VINDVFEGVVNLFIVGHATTTEGFDHAIETDLGGNYGYMREKSRKAYIPCGRYRRLWKLC
jgi:hypothetical protein